MKITFLIVALVFILFDIITGLVKAASTGTTSSSIMRVGLFHKVGEVLAILFGYACQFAFPYVDITIPIPMVEAISTYIILMEAASIIENLTKINPQLETILNKIFKKGDSDK